MEKDTFVFSFKTWLKFHKKAVKINNGQEYWQLIGYENDGGAEESNNGGIDWMTGLYRLVGGERECRQRKRRKVRSPGAYAQGIPTVEAEKMRKSARLAEKKKAKLEKEAQKDPKENQLSDKISKMAIDNDTTDGAEKMRRFDRLKEKKAKPKKKVQLEQRAKTNRSDNRISNIAAMDNGTMFEAFKFLNYYQLATNSHVSKRFWNLIRTHRHKLALLGVDQIYMYSRGVINHQNRAVIEMFNEELSTKEYNEWIVRNGYSKQIPFKGQMVNYELAAIVSQNPNYCHAIARTVLSVRTVELNNEHWPLFQHFIRLLRDPFIFIRTLTLKPYKDASSFFVEAMNPEHNRLQCKNLVIVSDGNDQKFIVWIKNHVRCDKLQIGSIALNDEELLDLFLTGALCTSSIFIRAYDFSQAIVALVQV